MAVAAGNGTLSSANMQNSAVPVQCAAMEVKFHFGNQFAVRCYRVD